MDESQLVELLEVRHEKWLEWEDEFPSAGPEGNELYAAVTCRASVHDCINMMRRACQIGGIPVENLVGNDQQFLEAFIKHSKAKIYEAPQH